MIAKRMGMHDWVGWYAPPDSGGGVSMLSPSLMWTAVIDHPAALMCVAPPLLLVAPENRATTFDQSSMLALALDDGRLQWHHTYDYAFVSGITAVDHTALISLTSTDFLRGQASLQALDTSGEPRWQWQPDGQRISTAACIDQSIYVVIDAQQVARLDAATGRLLSSFSLPETAASLAAPLVRPDILIVPCRQPMLMAATPDGTNLWQTHLPDTDTYDWLDKTPIILGDAVFAVGSRGTVAAFSLENGHLRWRQRVPVGSRRYAPGALATDGQRLFVACETGILALNPKDGSQLWQRVMGKRVTAVPVVKGGLVYAASQDHSLYALDGESGDIVWQYAVGRRLELAPLLADITHQPALVLADRGGNVTALKRPLTAEEYEEKGEWETAVALFIHAGHHDRAAAELQTHGQLMRAAELRRTAGQLEQAARLYEQAEAWLDAAALWAELFHGRRQAQALAQQAALTDDADAIGLWQQAAILFAAEGDNTAAANCRYEVARLRQLPILKVDVAHPGLMLNSYARLEFTLENVGFGLARNLYVRVHGHEFEGSLTATRQFVTLRPGQQRVDVLDVRPLVFGEVPLRVSIEYQDRYQQLHKQEEVVYLPVAQFPQEPRAQESFTIFREETEKFTVLRLADQIAYHFSLDEVRTLCIELDIDYESLPGEGAGKRRRVEEMVMYLRRRQRLQHLLRACQRLRPQAVWSVQSESEGDTKPTVDT